MRSEKYQSNRTLRFSHQNKRYRALKRGVSSELRAIKLSKRIAASLIENVFTELAHTKQIAYHNPSVGRRSRVQPCIFC